MINKLICLGLALTICSFSVVARNAGSAVFLYPYGQPTANGITVSQNGNVGIGTTSPGTLLTLSTTETGSATALSMGFGNRYGIGFNGDGAGNFNIFAHQTAQAIGIGFDTGSYGTFSEKVTILPGGNVGIGTANPGAKLTIVGDEMRLQTNDSYYSFYNTSGTRQGYIQHSSAGLYINNEQNTPVYFRTNNTDRMTVVAGGNVGIGTIAPSTKLDVAGTVSASAVQVNGTAAVNVGGGAASPQLLVEGDGAAYNAQIALRRANSTSAGGNIDWIGNTNVIGARIGVNDDIGGAMQFKLGGTGVIGDTKITITSVGNVGIGTTTPSRKLSVNGDAGGTSAWNNDSDVRLKKDIVTIPDALAKVRQLRGVNFSWKDTSHHPGGNQMGFIAQEALKVIPEVVSKPGEYYSMQYAPITALLVEAMKQQQIQIAKLVSENEQFKRDMVEIRRLLAR